MKDTTIIRTLIVDDEEHARLTLKGKIENYCPELKVIGMAENAAAAYEFIMKEQPELVFLDVAMPRESGFDLLKKLPEVNFELIFVTGFDTYAIDAITFCAIGYVLKPIQKESLLQAVHNAKAKILSKQDNQRNKELLSNISNPGSKRNKIGIPTSEGLEFVRTEDIIRCEGVQKCTRIYIKGAKNILSSYNIGEYIRLLEPYGFFATHKSHLINLDYIKKYQKDGNAYLEDGSAVPVSKRRRSQFLEQLTRL